MADASTVDAVIFDGGYGIDYVQFAADIFGQVHEGSTAKVSPSTQIASGAAAPLRRRQPAGPHRQLGRPVDRLQHDPRPARGPQRRSSTRRTSRARPSATRCTAACSSPARSATSSRRSTTPSPCTPCGTRAACSRRTAGRRRPPGQRPRSSAPRPRSRTSTCSCGARKRRPTTGPSSIESAIKEGGDEVRLALENLEEGAWSLPAVQAVLHRPQGDHRPRLHEARRRRHAVHARPRPSGALDQEALLYPSGSWIENEMKDQTAEGFAMKGVPAFTVTADSAMPADRAALRRRRAVHRPVRQGERRRRQGAAADHAVDGRGHQLRQDEAGPDDRQGPRPRRRLRLDGARVADRHARRRRRGHLQLGFYSDTVRHEPGRAAALELVPRR